MEYSAHPVIQSYNKLPCVNHFQPPSRPSCQWKPNFKQRFHQIHSVHIVLRLVRHDLITGLLVLWSQNYGIQYLVKNAWILENWPSFRGCTPKPSPLHEFAQFVALRTCMPFTHFSLGPTLKKNGCAPPPTHPLHTHSGYGPAYITISSLLLQLRNESRWVPSKSYHSRKIMT